MQRHVEDYQTYEECPLCRLRAAARRARQHYAEVQRQRRAFVAGKNAKRPLGPVARACRGFARYRFTRANVGGICPCSAPGDDCPRIMEYECDCHFDPSDAMEGQ